MGGYKTKTKKLVVLLYTNDEQVEKEIRKIISFTIASNNISYLELTLSMKVKACMVKTSSL